MIWILIALMSLLGVLFALYPLLRRRGTQPGATRLDVFERQLEEIALDEEGGVIGPAEAQAARLEVKRRILNTHSAGDMEQVRATAFGRGALLSFVVVAMAAGVTLYIGIGSPGQPDYPYSPPARQSMGDAVDGRDGGPGLNELVDRLIAHLDENPEDFQGWQHLRRAAPGLDRQTDLAAALVRATEARPDNPMLAMLYAESLIVLGQGQIGPAAELALARVRELAPDNPALRHYEALALYQNGEIAKARDHWAALLDDSPPDAPWRTEVQRRIASADRALGRQPSETADAPGDAQQAIADLPPDERERAIRGMVEGLADRLQDEPGNLDGWTRLARSWEVLGENGKAFNAWTHVRDVAREAGRDELVAEAEQERARLTQ